MSALSCSALIGGASVISTPAKAGDFTIDWGAFDWPAGFGGPLDRTLYDQYGFAVDVTVEVSGALDSYVNGAGQTVQTPDDDTIFGGNIESLILVADAPQNAGAIGDNRITNTVSASSGGVAVQVDNLRIDVLDIDTTDNNTTSDRCDFLTAFGDNGNPTLSTLGVSPSVVVGPGPGSGFTGALAANQAQCIYNNGATGSPSSPNDNNGTVRATFPNGTSSVTFWYDESIQNVRNYPAFQSYDPGARGIGMFAEANFSVGQSIGLDRTVTPASATEGATLTYSYTVTNTGTLPFNTGQDIVIEDSQLGTVTCPAITAPIASGGTVTCSTDYTVTAADVLSGSVDSTATAGIARTGTAFVNRLQSTSESVTVLALGGGTAPLTCTPQSIFGSPRTQLAGSGSAAAPGLDDIFLFDDVTTDSRGNPIDIVFQLTQISNAINTSISSGIQARMVPADNGFLTYRLRLVEDGSATTANPLGTTVGQSAYNGLIVQQTDVDSRDTADDSSDVVGSLVTPTNTIHFNTAPLASFPTGGTAIAMDPAKVGDPTNWIEEPNETAFDNYVTFEFDTFVEAEFIHGYTGSSLNAATRGSAILLCAIADTSVNVVAEDDDYTATPVNNLLGGTAGEVYANDTINGIAATVATAELSVLTPATPQITGDPIPFLETSGLDEGRVVVPAGVPSGVYEIEYEMCDALNPGDCDRAKVTVAVFSGNGVDFGDAPLSYLTASHGVSASPSLYLGNVAPDTEVLAQSDATATADDLLNTDDEDGVIFPVLTQGMISTLNVDVTGDGYLQAWIDFNGDGLFEETLGERISTDLRDDGTVFDNVAGDGVIQIDVTVPTDATTNTTFARFRYSSEQGLLPQSFAVDGEVEDYSLVIAAADFVDRGDAPASYGDPRHIVVPEIYLGSGLPDTEIAPQNSADADADDLAGSDDEDAIAVFPVLEAGTTVPLTIQTHETLSVQLALGLPVTEGITNLQLFIDFDQNGAFEADEQIATDFRDGGTGDLDGTFNNQISLNISVPTDIVSGFTYARVRWSTSSGLVANPFGGLNFDGEVEDYKVKLSAGAVPFSCDGTLYRVARVDSQLQRLVFTDTGGGAYTIDASNVGTPAGAAYNGGWGYNALDGLFYAVREFTRDLVRLDSTGKFDVVATLPATAADGYNSGDILSNGIMIYRVQGTNDFQLLDLSDPFNPVDAGRVTLTAPVDPFDIAYNPNDGMIYGVNHVTDRLFYFDPADGAPGTRTAVEFGPAIWDQAYGAIWFDFYGRMYVNQNTSNEVYEVDVGVQGSGTGNRTYISTISISEEFRNDGTACPSRFGPLPPFGALSGVVFSDTNQSQSYDASENTLSNVLVSLYDDNGTSANLTDDTFITSTDSSADGSYLFGDLSATATYRIEVNEADADLSASSTISTDNPLLAIRVTAGSTRSALDFGFYDPEDPEGPLVCDTGFFMVYESGGSPILEKLQITGSPGSYSSVRTTYPADFTGSYQTTGWGWSEVDNYIYGVLRNTFELNRVTYSGAVRPVVDMAGLGLGTVGSTLEILPNGVMVYNILGQSGRYQLVDISDPLNPVNLGVLDAGGSAPNGLDMTYNPRDGLLYMTANGNSIYAMDPKGGTAGATTTTLVAANVPLPAGFGSAQLDSVWMDENGFFYAYDNNSKQVFYVEVGAEGARPASYQFEAIDGTGSAPIGNDGASCRKGSFYASTVFAEGSISGTVFEDVNADTVLDAGDNGLGAIAVTLYNDNGTPADISDDTLVATTDSAADGTYSFATLDATQTYRIDVDAADADVPANLNLTSANPITGVVVTSGADTGDQNFAFTDPATPVYDPNGPFVCSDTFYMVATETAQNLPALSELRVTESGGTYNLSQTLLPPDYTGNYLVTGWGYNELDGYIYGVRQSPRTLMRIVASGAVQEVADISGLTIESPDTSSDILPNGVMVYMSGTNFGRYQLLDISDPLNPVALGVLDTGQSTLYGRDIAYNPRDGLLYFIDSNRNIYAIDPLGGTPGATTITLVGNVPLPVGIFSMDPDSVWFDGSGYLYLFDNQSRQVFAVEVGVEGNRPLTFSFIEVEGTVADLTYQGNDGASCRAPGPFASTLFAEGSISGTLYQDANGNSAFDTGETGVGAISVTLYSDNGTPADLSDDTLVATTESAADGSYGFAAVDATLTYRIEVDGADADTPAGYVIATSNPITGVVVTQGADTSGQDFGYVEGALAADLSLSKEARDTAGTPVTEAVEGAALDMVLSVSNAGPAAATGVKLRDLIPDGYSYVSDDAAALGDTYDPASGIWDIGAVANGETVTLTIRVTMNATGEHTNTAEIVAADQADPDSDPATGPLTDDLSDGIADDDEATATVALTGAGSVLSGTVFRDTGAGGGTAYDGLINGTEIGTAAATVAIYDGTGTLIDSPEVAADGTWSLTLPTGYSGAVTVTGTADAGHLVISETPAALPSLINADPRDGSLTFTPAAGTDYADIDMGVLRQAVLREDQAGSISAGQIATLRHEYTADAPGLVSFALTTISETPSGGYSAALFEDIGCDGTPDMTITGPLATAADTTICLVLRVSASSSLGPNASYVVKLDATTSYGATDVSEIDSNVDRLTTEARTGALDLSKTVRNVTQGGAEGIRNGGAPGDVLEYRISVYNPTALPASEVKIYDRTPPYTVLAAPIASPVTLGDMTCTIAEPLGNTAGYAGNLRWDCNGIFRPGAQGHVVFQVTIAP